jgi:hypothetical protein
MTWIRTRTAAFFLFIFLLPPALFAQVGEENIHVYFYPQALDTRDTLTDGPGGRTFRIAEDTFLVWVDLEPDMFFTHETCYILISKDRIRIKRGNWWPVLNDKPILHNEQGRYALISPFEMPSNTGNPPSPQDVAVHVFPHELTSLDRLQDGPYERLFRIHDNSMLIWVDLLPGAFFAHPTAYILISKHNIRVENGIWWPVLNGKMILYGENNKIGIISPIKVSRQR